MTLAEQVSELFKNVITEAVDLQCPNCGDIIGKASEQSVNAYCSNCGMKNIPNPDGIPNTASKRKVSKSSTISETPVKLSNKFKILSNAKNVSIEFKDANKGIIWVSYRYKGDGDTYHTYWAKITSKKDIRDLLALRDSYVERDAPLYGKNADNFLNDAKRYIKKYVKSAKTTETPSWVYTSANRDTEQRNLDRWLSSMGAL